MAHYARIENNLVAEVIVADADFVAGLSGTWVQTSYNTRGGIHYGADNLPDGGTPLRKNYAGIGFTYDADLDAFIPPKPYPSWILNTTTCLWNAPIPKPDDANAWDEATQSWITITP